MNRKQLLEQVKQAVYEVEPNADVIIYGSRSRKNSICGFESDWDFLILVDGLVDEERIDVIRHRLYEIEWECGEVISSIVRNREKWHSPLYKTMPFWKNVERGGVVL